MIIKLSKSNSRFKRLISQFGEDWEVINGPVSMFCFNGELGLTCRSILVSQKISNFKQSDVKVK